MAQKPFPPRPHVKPIFPPWQFEDWVAVDDRVRGGSSQSHLEPFTVNRSDGHVEGTKEASAARFWGTLDTKTLGGAGFASQRYVFGPTALHLPRHRYVGLALTYKPPQHPHMPALSQDKPAKPTTFTIVLDTNLPLAPHPLPPSRSSSVSSVEEEKPKPRPSRLTYEAQFDTSHLSLAPSSQTQTQGGVQVFLQWNDFKPFYRGRPVPPDDPRWAPLRSEQIFEMSLMCRSNFAKQEGDFEIVVLEVGGWVRDQKHSAGTRMIGWITGLVQGFWGWMTSLLRRQDGHVRLQDVDYEEKAQLR